MKLILIASLAACHSTTTTTDAPRAAKEAEPQAAEAKPTSTHASNSHMTVKPKKPGDATVSSSPDDLLEKGAAKKIQEALATKGYSVKATGVIDDQTEAGLRKFQKKEDIAEHGIPDEITVTRLGLDPRDVYKSNAIGDKEKNEKREAEKKK